MFPSSECVTVMHTLTISQSSDVPAISNIYFSRVSWFLIQYSSMMVVMSSGRANSQNNDGQTMHLADRVHRSRGNCRINYWGQDRPFGSSSLLVQAAGTCTSSTQVGAVCGLDSGCITLFRPPKIRAWRPAIRVQIYNVSIVCLCGDVPLPTHLPPKLSLF